jgi:hypothetical protein
MVLDKLCLFYSIPTVTHCGSILWCSYKLVPAMVPYSKHGTVSFNVYKYNICFMVYCSFVHNFCCTPGTLSSILHSMVFFSTMEQRYIMQYGSSCSSRSTIPCNSHIYCFPIVLKNHATYVPECIGFYTTINLHSFGTLEQVLESTA